MVAVCGNVVQEAERTQKELGAQRAEQERLRRDFAQMDAAMQNISDGTQKAHLRMDSLSRQAPKGAVQGLEERMAILEAESTIRRQQHAMGGGAAFRPSGGTDDTGSSSLDSSGSAEAYESRITAQVKLLEQKLLAAQKEEESIIQSKVDEIREALQKETTERTELSAALTLRMEERIKSLAEVIDTSTSEAVKEMSTLFEPEMQRLRGQFDASMAVEAKLTALQEQVRNLEGGATKPDEAAELIALRHRMQSLEKDLQIMLQSKDAGEDSGPVVLSASGPGADAVAELQRTVDTKLAAFERAHKLQNKNREVLEEQVFAIRRSLPTIDRLAASIRESMDSQQQAEQELLAVKSMLSKQEQADSDAVSNLKATVARQGQDLAALSGSAESGSALDSRLKTTEKRLDQLDSSVAEAVRNLEGVRGSVMLEMSEMMSGVPTAAQVQRQDDEIMRLGMLVDRQTPTSQRTKSATAPSGSTAGSFSEAASQDTLGNSSLDRSGQKPRPEPIGRQILDEITKIEEKMAHQTQKSTTAAKGASVDQILASPMPAAIPPVGLGISVHDTSELKHLEPEPEPEPEPKQHSAPAPAPKASETPIQTLRKARMTHANIAGRF